jgi:regulator of protease activity HflC (stomatin/prohibitin superfamily)
METTIEVIAVDTGTAISEAQPPDVRSGCAHQAITNSFGVEVISINIIFTNPVDDQLTVSLATGAVASAEALQAKTAARGRAMVIKIEAEAAAVATKINADSEAMATLVKARAEGEAVTLRAEGAKAAKILRAGGCKQAAELVPNVWERVRNILR